MNKYSVLQQFEKTKLEEVEKFKSEQQENFLAIETEHQNRMQNIVKDLASYKEELKLDYSKKLQEESLKVSKETEIQIQNINNHKSDLQPLAKEIAKLITQ